MKCNFLIFGGTTEGRLLAERLSKMGIPHAVSVATRYGEEIEQNEGERNLLVGRMTSEEMACCIRTGAYTHVVDATHPFAVDASAQIASACKIANVPCYRLSRDTRAGSLSASAPVSAGSLSAPEPVNTAGPNGPALICVDDLNGAAAVINETDGPVLLFTGSKDLAALTSRIEDPSRVFARVLPNEESLIKCREAGLSGKQIIAMQGPFSKEMNAAMIRQTGAAAILTKESGRAGGLAEKLEAAGECGAAAIVIRNPEQERGQGGQSFDMEGIMEIIASLTGSDFRRQITLAGIGPGDDRFFTKELEAALRKADIVFGAGPVVGRLPASVRSRVRTEEMYRAEEILKYLEDNKSYRNPVVVFSGDISLCSGAKRATAQFRSAGYNVKRISGISSVSLFANRLGIALEETAVVSSHGRNCNVAGYAMRNEKTIALTSGSKDAAALCESLPPHVRVTAGCDLGMESERIFEVPAGCPAAADLEKERKLGGTQEPAADRAEGAHGADRTEGVPGADRTEGAPDTGCSFTSRTLLYIENPMAASFPVYPGIADDEFIRGEVPMTKEEIRAFSIRKLRLHRKAVLYDIGAGTGSVSIEAALLDPEIEVFSIERSPKALELLRLNREKFHAGNVHIIEGTAPEAIRDIPSPTHVFIGGSGGGMKRIMERVMELNDKARIVVNCVTPETLSEVMAVSRELQLPDPEIVQITAARYRRAGNYHLPQMVNPVYIICVDLQARP